MNAWSEAIVWAVGFVVLVVASGFFSGMAAALIAVNRFRLRQGAEIERNERAARVVALFGDAHHVLAVSLIGSTLTNVAALTSLILALSSLRETRAQPLDWKTTAVALLAALPFMLVVGEVVPRRLFRERPNRLLVSLYHPLRWSLTLLGPLARAGIWLARQVARWSGRRELSPGVWIHSESWQWILAAEEKALPSAAEQETTESRMIHGIFDLQKTRAREVMSPLVDLAAVHLPESVGVVRALARQSGYSRFPVYRDRIINLVGYLDIYDVLAAEPADDQPAGNYVRKALYVPEMKRLDDLLREMLQSRHKVAIVVDEYGSCSGWITREDLLEEIVGEIEDEFDQASVPIRQIDQRTYVVSAAIHVDDLNESLALHLPSDEFDTLGGFVYDRLARIPQVGDAFEDNGVRYEVLEMDNRRIVSAQITLAAAGHTEEETR